MGETSPGKQEGRLHLRPRTYYAVFGQPVAAAKVRARGDKAMRPQDQRAFENRAAFDNRRPMDCDLLRDVELALAESASIARTIAGAWMVIPRCAIERTPAARR